MSARNSVTASTLGSYFGVGYNKPLEQLGYDKGEDEIHFMEAQEQAMEVSSLVEEGILDIVEARNNCIITQRNTETLTAMDGKLRVRKDGFTSINGENYVVEVKHVASGGNLINNKGYHFQVMAQIIAEREKGIKVDKGILAGLYKGKYYQIILELTPELEQDIHIMINTVVAILQGDLPETMFPANITDKYSPLQVESEEFKESDIDIVNNLIDIKENIKELKEQEKNATDYLKERYESLDYTTAEGSNITVSNQIRKGKVDLEAIVTDHPEVDIEKYRKEPSSYKVIRTK